MSQPRLTRQLLAWILGSLVLLWGTFILMGYRTGEHEADELTDGHLAATAALLVNLRGGEFSPGSFNQSPAGGNDLKSHDYQQSMTVVLWDVEGRVRTHAGDGPMPAFTPDEGFQTLALGNPAVPWRAFSLWNKARDTRVTVLLALSERDALAQDIAGQIMEPGLWLLPLLALALGLAVHRGLRPLYALSTEINALDVRKPHAMPTAGRHEEFQAAVNAINSLVARYQASLDRERALADEFAHELRTPLTSLSLQVQALRGQPDGAARDTAMKHLAVDVLRTGDIISQLLSLARASRAELNEARQAVDVNEIARTVVADFAPSAFATERELSLSLRGNLQVQGHPVLLRIAIRNLVENALRHTPPGSHVEVQVLADQSVVQVCDAPGTGDAEGSSSPQEPAAGLGLGHRVVRRIAAVHGADFDRAEPPEGFTRSYRLSFAQPLT